MMSAVTGFDDGKDGKNASTNKVAGRSQSSIAAVSIGTVPQLEGLAVAPVCSPNAGRMPGIVGPRHPAVYGAAFTDSRVPQPCEDAAEVVADGGEDDVGGIAGAALEIAAAEVTFGLQVALGGGSASQLALDGAEDAAFLAADEDPAWILRVMATVSLVDIGPLDRTSGQCFGIVDDVAQGVTIVRDVRQRLGVQHD